ncbi:MAG TPA: tRNA uridine-5-carboxymethylaminomethyl(34) synthesis GTPase MnmE, partial [Stenotrophomonas sp.]|nr:tRNA uridine-5-carboxymethylaminomethyl(34) synthesis GTPase MnmE [Stenotrophomonas sp.]
ETIRIDGLELELVDTAGLREGGDAIEREGMRRARAEMQRADLSLVVLDARDPKAGRKAIGDAAAQAARRLWILNKCDLLPQWPHPLGDDEIAISAASGQGLEQLHARLRELAGDGAGEGQQGEFSARLRHVQAIVRAAAHLDDADAQLRHDHLELAAEELRLAHDALGEITGRMTADDLLGRIFSSFCIGK